MCYYIEPYVSRKKMFSFMLGLYDITTFEKKYWFYV